MTNIAAIFNHLVFRGFISSFVPEDFAKYFAAPF
jgi:hypothetical protein